MNVQYRQAFLKDLKKLKGLDAYNCIYAIAFDDLPAAASLQDVSNIRAMQGHNNRYRIRVGNYRIGIETTEDGIEVIRVLHRKEFYRFFP